MRAAFVSFLVFIYFLIFIKQAQAMSRLEQKHTKQCLPFSVKRHIILNIMKSNGTDTCTCSMLAEIAVDYDIRSSFHRAGVINYCDIRASGYWRESVSCFN